MILYDFLKEKLNSFLKNQIILNIYVFINFLTVFSSFIESYKLKYIFLYSIVNFLIMES